MKKFLFAFRLCFFSSIALLAVIFSRKIKHGKRTVYLSGKISGLAYNDYMTKFRDAELAVRESFKGRVEVISPTSLSPLFGIRSWFCYMVPCVAALAACDAIYMLDNWRHSRGARIERLVAIRLGLRVLADNYGVPQPVNNLQMLSAYVRQELIIAPAVIQEEALSAAANVLKKYSC